MNKIGIHALVWVGGWSETECRKAIKSSREAGYDLIEIPALDPSSINTSFTRKVLEEYGLSAACSLGLEMHTDISSSDPEVVARGEHVLNDALAVTRDLGGTYMGGILYSALGKYARPATPEGHAHSVEVLSRLAERAAAN